MIKFRESYEICLCNTTETITWKTSVNSTAKIVLWAIRTKWLIGKGIYNTFWKWFSHNAMYAQYSFSKYLEISCSVHCYIWCKYPICWNFEVLSNVKTDRKFSNLNEENTMIFRFLKLRVIRQERFWKASNEQYIKAEMNIRNWYLFILLIFKDKAHVVF